MKDVSYKASGPSVTQLLPKWGDVLNFLGKLQAPADRGEVHITKKEGEHWEVQTNFSKKQKPIALSTRCRGVGLFDLNW